MADYAGAASAAAASVAPRPLYDRLVDLPMELSDEVTAESSAGAVRVAGGRGSTGGSSGRSGRGSARRAPATVAFRGRYFDAEERAATPGQLSAELRALLGMREGDPPPYLSRMQQLGYPPGYLGDPSSRDAEDAPLVLIESAAEEGRRQSGSQAEARSGGAPPRQPPTRRVPVRVPMVDFPGLNVPPPPGADPYSWGWR